jgi:hypothetical protein
MVRPVFFRLQVAPFNSGQLTVALALILVLVLVLVAVAVAVAVVVGIVFVVDSSSSNHSWHLAIASSRAPANRTAPLVAAATVCPESS